MPIKNQIKDIEQHTIFSLPLTPNETNGGLTLSSTPLNPQDTVTVIQSDSTGKSIIPESARKVTIIDAGKGSN